MAVKLYKPTSAGRRIASVTDYSILEKNVKAPKRLRKSKINAAGRNNSGKITVRHRGGGHRHMTRSIDFVRAGKKNIPAVVQTVEYDPTRTGFISLIAYRDGEKRYMLTPLGVKVGDTVLYSDSSEEMKPGNRMPLSAIPVGTAIHDVEIAPGQGGRIARSAGTSVTLMTTEAGYALLKLPSGEIRKVSTDCAATIGQISNHDWMNVRIGKAGRVRHMGRRPQVRGKAMNPVDHPHGGGEGHNPIGLKYPKTYTGRHALGVKTRRPKKYSTRFIVKRRTK